MGKTPLILNLADLHVTNGFQNILFITCFSIVCSLPMVKDISGLGPVDINRPLATPTSVNPNPIYTDKGSEANYDFGFWRIVCPVGRARVL
jgi:hypothetical protein